MRWKCAWAYKSFTQLQLPTLSLQLTSLGLNMFPSWNTEHQTVAGIQLGLFTILPGVTRDFIGLPLGPISSPEWYIINKTWSPQLCVPHCKDGVAAITLYLYTAAMTWYYMGARMPLCTPLFLLWCAHCDLGEAERRDRWFMFDQPSLHLLYLSPRLTRSLTSYLFPSLPSPPTCVRACLLRASRAAGSSRYPCQNPGY